MGFRMSASPSPVITTVRRSPAEPTIGLLRVACALMGACAVDGRLRSGTDGESWDCATVRLPLSCGVGRAGRYTRLLHALPGDPVRDALGLKTPAAVIAAERHKLGLDASIWHLNP